MKYTVHDDVEPEGGDVLTMETLNATMAKLRDLGNMGCVEPGAMSSWGGPWLYAGPRIFVADYLPTEQPRKLTRFERFRVWVEDLADRADVYYHYPRVKRTDPAPAGYLFGRDLYVRPSAEAAIRINYTT